MTDETLEMLSGGDLRSSGRADEVAEEDTPTHPRGPHLSPHTSIISVKKLTYIFEYVKPWRSQITVTGLPKEC